MLGVTDSPTHSNPGRFSPRRAMSGRYGSGHPRAGSHPCRGLAENTAARRDRSLACGARLSPTGQRVSPPAFGRVRHTGTGAAKGVYARTACSRSVTKSYRPGRLRTRLRCPGRSHHPSPARDTPVASSILLFGLPAGRRRCPDVVADPAICRGGVARPDLAQPPPPRARRRAVRRPCVVIRVAADLRRCGLTSLSGWRRSPLAGRSEA